ncbi:hypothetical protein MJO28_017734 [Puccinia striiformis f. sp. tritici]|nr:hypothetical protein MJO28_017734 [Puccinia striiformis f. sp. tritici]
MDITINDSGATQTQLYEFFELNYKSRGKDLSRKKAGLKLYPRCEVLNCKPRGKNRRWPVGRLTSTVR